MKKLSNLTRSKKPTTTFEPGKVSLAVASLAAVSILLLAIVAVTR
ncbi:MAG: hypothetical protein ABIQ64_03230 [Candidatus Saccharimonadales bacterium]